MMEGIRKTIFLITGSIAIFLVLLYIGNIIVIGDKLGGISIWLELSFNLIMIFGPLGMIAYCIARSLQYRSFNLARLKEDHLDAETERMCGQLIEHILANDKIDEARKSILLDPYANYNECIDRYLSKSEEMAKKEARKHALMAAVSVTLSPTSTGDMMFMFLWNIRLTNRIIEIYGIRPSLSQLLRIYQHVLFGGLLAASVDEILESLDVDSLLSKVPILGKRWVPQAICSVFSTLRTGYLARYYLRHGFSDSERIKAKKEARKHAREELPGVLKEAAACCSYLKPKVFKNWWSNQPNDCAD